VNSQPQDLLIEEECHQPADERGGREQLQRHPQAEVGDVRSR
jgi:hypothetical protein